MHFINMYLTHMLFNNGIFKLKHQLHSNVNLQVAMSNRRTKTTWNNWNNTYKKQSFVFALTLKMQGNNTETPIPFCRISSLDVYVVYQTNNQSLLAQSSPRCVFIVSILRYLFFALRYFYSISTHICLSHENHANICTTFITWLW